MKITHAKKTIKKNTLPQCCVNNTPKYLVQRKEQGPIQHKPWPIQTVKYFQNSYRLSSQLQLISQSVSTGYTSQGSRMCSGRSAGFDLTGPVDFLLAQSHTEL